jgi:hypothetical protein
MQSVFMALGTTIPALVMAWKQLSDAKIKETLITAANTVASTANAKAKANEGKSAKESIKERFKSVGQDIKERLTSSWEKTWQQASFNNRYELTGKKGDKIKLKNGTIQKLKADQYKDKITGQTGSI